MARVTQLTVRELIERLSRYDPDHRVVVNVNDDGSPAYGVFRVDLGGYTDDLTLALATDGENPADYPGDLASCWNNPCVVLTVDTLRQLEAWGVKL